jgi:cellulose biosynthesis protein BcsQ
MKEYQEKLIEIRNQGQKVPVISFYSVQGGVGKTTLARKFAELVTVAPGREERRPNVLLVDFDVEAQGLTFRLSHGLRQNFRTVHEVIAERNVTVVQAVTVTSAVALASGNPEQRGQLYLMPAAPPEAKGLFDTISTINKEELFDLLLNMIISLVAQYDISCVIIDCAPGANPYTAAAATLADYPLLIGRNEDTTYDQIRILPERFREWYSEFQPSKQRVIINSVTVKELYKIKAQQFSVFDYIPLTTDVILETEGLPRTGSLRMLLFEKYIVDIIKKVLVGMSHLIPKAPDVLGHEWMEMLEKLEHCKEAPTVRRLRILRYLRWFGMGIGLIGIILIILDRIITDFSLISSDIGIFTMSTGILIAIGGWYADSKYRAWFQLRPQGGQ